MALVKCLFCPNVFHDVDQCFMHSNEAHGFSFVSFVGLHELDGETYCRAINYIRRHEPTPQQFVSISRRIWDASEYDTVVDLSDELIWNWPPGVSPKIRESEPMHIPIPIQDIPVGLRESPILPSLLTDEDTRNNNINKGSKTEEDDEDYYDSYTRLGIHQEMLLDTVRTGAYRDAVLRNRELFQNKIVLDLGCGTGILSLFCAAAGAQKVYAIEKSRIIETAEKVIRKNNEESVITLIHSIAEDAVLPVNKVDIIISEWMGYGLLAEGMLHSVLAARDRYLKTDGYILPDSATLYICAFSDEDKFHSLFKFWDKAYGFDLSDLKYEAQHVLIDQIPADLILTNTCTLNSWNLYQCSSSDLEFKSEFILESHKTQPITGFCLFFETDFQLPAPSSITTSPFKPLTHWAQSVLWLPEPYLATQGETLSGSIEYKQVESCKRSFTVVLEFNSAKHEFLLG